MATSSLRRRDVLRGVGAGALALGGVGTAAAAGSNRFIVGTASPAATRAATRRADAVGRVLDFGDVGQAVAGAFSDRALRALRARRDVRYVEADGTWQAIAQDLPWGVDRTDAEVAHAGGDTGAGADVAIIDTGIDSDHPDLQANVGAGKAFTSCKGGPNDCLHSWDDDNDHGTHCAGIADAVDNTSGVVGVSTAATLHAVKVLDKQGSGYWSDIAAGIEYVTDQGWDVASLSLGGSTGSRTVADACQYAVDRGVFVVAAAGNDGPCSDCVGYPAAYSTVVAVSATASDDSLAGFSSTGPEVELAAPGEAVRSTVVGGYDTFSGTSMACPHVAGAAGQLMANGASNADARGTLETTAEDLGLAANEQGSGLLDVAAALGYDSSDDLSGDDGGDGGGGGGGGGTAPTGTVLAVDETESRNPHAEFAVSWEASDDDGDLASVELALADATDGGGVESTETVSASGSTASGTTTLKAKHDDGAGHQYDVALTVTDAAGNEGTDSATVTENGA